MARRPHGATHPALDVLLAAAASATRGALANALHYAVGAALASTLLVDGAVMNAIDAAP